MKEKINIILKIIIIVAVLIITGSIFYYFVIFLPHQERELNHGLSSQSSEEEAESHSELENQIAIIGQILSESSDIRVACLIVGVGNYIEKYGTQEEMKSLSNNYEKTKNDCFNYSIVYNQIANFVAEPELASVKQKLSQAGDKLREFGAYVMLDKGLDGKIIDVYEEDLQKLITQTREEILKVKRTYNLEK